MILLSANFKVTFLTDDTVRVEATIKDFSGALTNPTSNTVIVSDPAGTIMGTLSAVSAGTGLFTADYVVPAGGTAGVWSCSWKALFGAYPVREKIGFQVGR